MRGGGARTRTNQKIIRMIVLSLFDGISCGRMALEALGANVEKYYASEIDKYAILNTQKNYPDTVQLGDVNNWRSWDIEWASIDIILAGSPCQGFSTLGKKRMLNDSRSKLIFTFFDIFDYVKAMNKNVLFLLENVRVPDEVRNLIYSRIGVNPMTINSALVSAQNRVRLYWTNIKDGSIPLPLDLGVTIRDIIEPEVPERYFLTPYASETLIREFPATLKSLRDKSRCVLTTSGKYTKSRGCYLLQGGKVRRFTPKEVARLQTIPDTYKFFVPEGEIYKQVGNGWTVEVIKHILSYAQFNTIP